MSSISTPLSSGARTPASSGSSGNNDKSHALAAAAAASRPNSVTLPTELLYAIFLQCDPATVLLTLRSLSTSWRTKVDRALLPHLFKTGAWRVGLQISRRPRHGHVWGGSVVGSSTTTPDVTPEVEDEEMRRQRWEYQNDLVRRRTGALEDELPGFPLPRATSGKPAPVTHVIALEFERISSRPLAESSSEPTLRFSTGSSNWYALFESHDEEGLPDDPEQRQIERKKRREEARLALDFGLIWRFPGDGQGDTEWGSPDPEMGWLSRFYCVSGSKYAGGRAIVADVDAVSLSRKVILSRIHLLIQCHSRHGESRLCARRPWLVALDRVIMTIRHSTGQMLGRR